VAGQHAAERLLALGYKDVQAYRGGIEEWKAAGLPIAEAKAKPSPPE